MLVQRLFKYFIILILFFVFSVTTFAHESTMNGIDISEWQGDIDFQAVKENGIEIVYIRAGEGSDYEDAYFQSHYEGAKKSGLKIGFYHYVTATSTIKAKEQAHYFASLIEDKTMDCKPAMDFESFSTLSNSEINEIATIYLETLAQLTGTTPMLYSDAFNAGNLWESSLTAYPLWVAEYDVTSPHTLGHWETWVGFQYSDTGQINGISGNVDLDYFKDTVFIDPVETPISNPVPTPIAPPTYTVQPGNTLSQIALQFNTTVQTLVNLNHISNPNLIYVGQVLLLPTIASSSNTAPIHPPTTPAPLPHTQPAFITYTVQSGDTLSGIAFKYHTTVSALAELNHISNPNLIYIGQLLYISQTHVSESLPKPESTFINPNLIYIGQVIHIPN